MSVDERERNCDVCGLGRHRFSRDSSGAPLDLDKHKPTAVACANSIVGLVARSYGSEPSAEIVGAITKMGFYIDALFGDPSVRLRGME